MTGPLPKLSGQESQVFYLSEALQPLTMVPSLLNNLGDPFLGLQDSLVLKSPRWLNHKLQAFSLCSKQNPTFISNSVRDKVVYLHTLFHHTSQWKSQNWLWPQKAFISLYQCLLESDFSSHVSLLKEKETIASLYKSSLFFVRWPFDWTYQTMKKYLIIWSMANYSSLPKGCSINYSQKLLSKQYSWRFTFPSQSPLSCRWKISLVLIQCSQRQHRRKVFLKGLFRGRYTELMWSEKSSCP